MICSARAEPQWVPDHESLRDELKRTEALAEEFRQEGRQLIGPLGQQLETLLQQLQKHMHWEESQHADSPDERGIRRHREQCELLGELASDLRFGARPSTIIAAHIAAVAGLLRRDFEDLERGPSPPPS